jgi:MFS family permease
MLYTLTHHTAALAAIQILDGLGAEFFGVVSVLVIADLIQGTGRCNLTLGAITTAVGIGAALSRTMAGSIVYDLSFNIGFLILGAVALAAFANLFLLMPETPDQQFMDLTL